MNNVSDRKNRPNAFADRIAGINDPSMGDERERDVILRAYTFGSIISTYAFFALGVLFAVIGGGLWTVPIILASGAMGVAVALYCRREGVDFRMRLARVASKRLTISYLISVPFIAVWLFAIIYHQTTGHPLINAGLGTMFGDPGGGSSMIIGAACGVLAVIVVNMITRRRKIKQARAEAAAADEIDDED
ncbi:hypothetical protein [Brevibacterium sp. 'Marine']|uniref:hypothetical protein n=1 Tax=Brevibacterium sp. 'Marine' TaxID=2725563 RepID=UPI00145F3442|nr:hypothetical protein [Brevibacterium sp. 'Marine']